MRAARRAEGTCVSAYVSTRMRSHRDTENTKIEPSETE